MKKYFLLFTVILLVSCRSKTDKQALLQQNLSVEATLRTILSEEYSETLGIDEEGRSLLYSFYEKRNFKPLWAGKKSMSNTGEELMFLLKQPIRFGLPDSRFDLIWNNGIPVQNEIVIACGLARSYEDLRYGMLDSALTQLKPHRYVPIQALDTLLDFKHESCAQKIIAWGPGDTTYRQLANVLFHFVQNNPVTEEKADLKTIREDTIAAITGTKEILLAKKYLDSTQLNDSTAFVTALKKFQADNGCNPDGIIGKSTVRILTETNLHKAQRIAWAMEKQRKRTTYPKRYIHINIPEYKLRFFNEDTLCIETRIVVGKYENQTPELTSNMHSIFVYPYWTVPYSISSKEILPAAQRNPDYFEKNDMVVLKKGEPVDPYSVNWKKISEKSFPYVVRQNPGYKNSLGILKFDFYNKYDVYVHDTPSKNLFSTVARSYSHGCIRTENPVDLAKLILETDENTVTADSLDTLISHVGRNVQIRLKKRTPVFIEYNSVIVQNSEPVILRDVYLHDDTYIKRMFGKEEHK